MRDADLPGAKTISFFSQKHLAGVASAATHVDFPEVSRRKDKPFPSTPSSAWIPEKKKDSLQCSGEAGRQVSLSTEEMGSGMESISRNTSRALFEVWRTDTRLRVGSDLPGSSAGTIFVSVPALIFVCDHVHLLLALLRDEALHPVT